ncbi:MAG: hypothetical protein LBP22_04150 [Deltaproteobacteria bacterium]|jgi:hypothetical protein|nr:hypothetical protein [Deltaproteobacteria bacterium]
MGKKTALIIPAFLLSVLLNLSPSAVADTSGLVEMEFDRTPQAPQGCGFPGLAIPDNARVYAVGGYNGEPLGWTIDRSGHRATSIKVGVNSPQAPVILMLGAYEPNVWQIGWTRGTQILAVIVSGYHSQFVSGLPPETQLLVGSYDQGGPCARFKVRNDLQEIKVLNSLSQHLFGRDLGDMSQAEKGQALIGPQTGDKYYTARALSPGDFSVTATPLDREKNSPAPMALNGSDALREAIRQGQIKPASSTEFSQWAKVRLEEEKRQARANGVPENLIAPKDYSGGLVRHNAYLVTSSEFFLPEGLTGAHSATFFIPPGMPVPRGPMGHCRILFLENGRSLGPGQ